MTEGEHDHPARHHRPGFIGRLRANFLTGIVVIAPVGLTVWLIWTVIGWIDSAVLPFVPAAYHPEVLARRIFGPDATINIRGIGVVFFLIFTVFVGWVARGVIGRSLIRYAESLVDRMPVVRSIYNAAKQIAETVLAQSESSFDKACLIEYPRRGIWAIGFVSTTAKGEIARRLVDSAAAPEAGVEGPEDYLSIFLPTTPNPTSGFLLYLPRKDVIILDMTIEDSAKLVISAGLVYPETRAEREASWQARHSRQD